MSILFFGHSSFAAKSLRNFTKKLGIIYFSRKKNKTFLFDLRKKKKFY